MKEEVNKEASMYTIRAPHVEFPAVWGTDCWEKVSNISKIKFHLHHNHTTKCLIIYLSDNSICILFIQQNFDK